MIGYAFIWLFIVIAINVFVDHGKNHNDVYHGEEAFFKCLALIPSTVMFVWWHGINGQFFWVLFVSLAMQFFIYWTVFDGCENIFNLKKKWTYMGDGDGIKDGFLDKLQRFIGVWPSQAFKYCMIITWSTIYFLSK